jgi:hypothetical protein
MTTLFQKSEESSEKDFKQNSNASPNNEKTDKLKMLLLKRKLKK